MATGTRTQIFDSPVQVIPGHDGSVRMLLPDGHSLTLSPEAAERSAGMLARIAGVVSTGRGAVRARRRARQAQVIPVDFVHHARIA